MNQVNPKHFEELWEFAEKSFSKNDDNINSILTHLLVKVNFYEKIAKQGPTSQEEIKKIKSHLMGEILLTLSHLSLKENIDVFSALKTALYFSNIENLSKNQSV